MSSGYRTLHLDDIPTVRFDDDADIPAWKPVRRELGISAFGTNAYVADAPATSSSSRTTSSRPDA